MNPILVVLAAGMGSRYGGLKQLDTLGPCGETIIDYSVYDAVNAGFDKIVYIVRRSFREEFERHTSQRYGNLTTPEGKKVELCFVEQELDKLPEGFAPAPDRVKPWGTGHALLMCRGVIDRPFAVINGDDYYGKESFREIARYLREVNGHKGAFAMVGFILENTLSESGGVSRGVCTTDSEGFLTHIEETHNIMRRPDGTITGTGAEGNEKPLAKDTLVSMNMWGFTPDYLQASEGLFTEFLKEHGGELKSEFYIPSAVDALISSGYARTAMLSTPEKWFGVTFKEDRQEVVDKFKEFADRGIYPTPLFKQQ